MRFKIDENLKMVAAVTEYDPATVAVGLCSRFIDEGMIKLRRDNFNVTVLQATGPQYISDVCEILADYLYNVASHPVTAEIFEAFCKLVIVPDGCPHCGGEIKYVETEGHELKDGDYYTPNSYIVDYFIYECVECGAKIKSEKEL